MEIDTITPFIVATILLFLGHVARAMRWALLFPPGKLTSRFDLLLGLSLGYAINVVFPWRIGEILRAYFVSVRESIDFSYVAATVVVERLTDLVIVALILVALAYFSVKPNFELLKIAIFMMSSALVGVILVILVRRSLVLRRLIWSVSSTFNDSIRTGILDFFWSVSEITLGSRIWCRNYFIATVIMWITYTSSYLMFGWAVSKALDDTFYTFLGSPLLPVISGAADGLWPVPLLLFSTLPVIAVIVYGFSRRWSAIIRDFSVKIRFGGSIQKPNFFQVRDKFKQGNEYNYFLDSYFSGEDKVLSSFGLLSMDDGVIHRLFNGGSDAITALVEIDEKLVIRKYAVGAAGLKLKGQADWIKLHQNDNIPVVELISEKQGTFFYRYDMPFIASTNDFYDVIHTVHIDWSKSLLNSVLEGISDFHKRYENSNATIEVVESYLTEKVIKNSIKILDFAKDLLPASEYQINGTKYYLSDWDRLQDIHWLLRQVRELRTSSIHGDLTIENVIVMPEKSPGFYFIDPNSDNIFNTPLIDLSKLMQSLHLGYEGLNRRGQLSSISGGEIILSFTRSHAYSALHEHYDSLIKNKYGVEILREIYFHELINYLRLTPYKIRKNPSMGLTFFACTSILLDRYFNLEK
jgi:hypothetical protein